MRLYHVRSAAGDTPNYEAVCVDSMYRGWNPGRSSGAFGTGLYCTLLPPRIHQPARLLVYEVEARFYQVTSLKHEMALGEFIGALTRFVVSSLHRLYTSAKRAPLAAWFDHYSLADFQEYKRDLVAAIEELCSVTDPLTRHLKSALRDRDDLLFDFVVRYCDVINDGPHFDSEGCDGRRSPFTALLVQLGYDGLMYEGDAAFLNNRESHGVVLFDIALTPLSESAVDPSWTASYRASLLQRPRRVKLTGALSRTSRRTHASSSDLCTRLA